MPDLNTIDNFNNTTTYRGADVNAGAVEQTFATSWNIRTGGMTKRTFRGKPADIIAIATDAQTQGYEYNIVAGAVWTLEVIVPIDLVVNDTENEPLPIPNWELNYQSFQTDVLESKRPFVSELNSKTKQKILNTLRGPQNKILELTDVGQELLLPNALVAFNLKLIGAGQKDGFIPVLRKTFVVRNDFDTTDLFKPEFNGEVMTLGELLNLQVSTNQLANIPDVISNQLPDTIQTINQDGDLVDAEGFTMSPDGIVTFVGYLQFPIQISSVSLNKVQISQEWVFNQWVAGSFGYYDIAYPNSHQEPDVYAFLSR